MADTATLITTAALFLPLAGAIVAPALTRILKHHAAWGLCLFLLAPFLSFLWQSAAMMTMGAAVSGAADNAVLTSLPWIPGLRVDFSLRLDGLSLGFALLISGIGTLIVLYAGGYMKGHPQQGRFFSFLLMFSTAMLGVVLADNLLTLFVFWELTSITSFLLIGFDHERQASRRSAFQALLVTGAGGLFLLAGFVLAMAASGKTSMTGLLSDAAAIRDLPGMHVALGLMIVAAFTKSAQFPFHFWLPNAMEAPTPVSAFLHSATMVKAGVYLLMRLSPAFQDLVLWQTVLPVFGAATCLLGAVLSVRQTDLKLMLAYTTVSSLGLLTMLTGMGTGVAVSAAVLYLLAHALFKGALFMIAGVIDHETGTRDIRALGGLAGKMPLTFAAAVLAGASMAGIPLLAGFMAKEEIYAALSRGGGSEFLLFGVAFLANALMGAAGLAIAIRPFLGSLRSTPRKPHDGPALLMAGPVLLALKGLAVGLSASFVHRLFTMPMAAQIQGSHVDIEVSGFPHASVEFALSLATLAVASLVVWKLGQVRGVLTRLFDASGFTFDRLFDRLVSGLVQFAVRITKILQPGRLEIYLTLVFAVIALALWVPMLVHAELPSLTGLKFNLQLHEAAFMLMAVLGLFAVLVARSRLTAIVSLGIQGFAVAVLYLLFGAPDLSFTQFMVETLSVVILALIMTRLKLDVTDHRPVRQILIDAPIAVAAGTGFALYLLRTVEVPFNESLSVFFESYSKVLAHGANVVNVIIVDFRGSDTMGEIAVVTITGLAILALIRFRGAAPLPIADNAETEESEAA